jgi:copper transport protein
VEGGRILLVRLAKGWLACAAALAVLLALASTAAAHSTLVSTEPARDRVVDHSPKTVALHFDEPVETALGSITLYDGDGGRVDAGKIMRPSPESVEVTIPRRLEQGTYTVVWRVISADSDPIKGAWVFHVEKPGAQPSGIAAQVLKDTPFVVSAFYLGGRFLDFALLLACVGGTIALTIALRGSAGPIRRRLLGVLAVLAGLLTVVALVGLGLQAAAAGGESLGEGFRWDSIESVADTRFGHFSLARAGLAAALCAVALIARRALRADGDAGPHGGHESRSNGREGTDGRAPRGRFERRHRDAATQGGGPSFEQRAVARPVQRSAMLVERSPVSEERGAAPAPIAQSAPELRGRTPATATAAMLVLAAGLVFTPGLSGHASVTGIGSVIADAAHVLAAATWTGGLAFLVAGLVMAGVDRWPLAALAVPRFSTTAVVSVAILLVAGAINGYLQVRAWRGLWETEYGILLLVKIGLVLPLLALGAYNNRFAVPRLRRQIASAVERRRFIRMAGAELVIMLAIVGVTAGLVNAPPARTEISMHEASEIELRLGPMRADMEVMPATVGPNEIHLKFTEGRPDEVTVTAGLKAKDIGPLRYTARRSMEAGTYEVKRANLSPAGDWDLLIEARRGKFDLFSEKVQMSIQKEF